MHMQLMASKRHSDLTDDVLIQQAQIGDQDAFEILVDRYRALLFHLTSTMLRDEHHAYDVLQHVYIQLYRSLPTLRPGGTIKSWLCQVARRRCIDELRRKRPICFSEMEEDSDGGELSLLAALPDPERRMEEQIELGELRQQLLDAIATLPAHVRAVVLLRYATHLSFREIGQALDIPEATAKTYFYRAKQPLRALLEPEFEQYRVMEKQ
jgi:RNA polymerase sigma factor (sigma-70 family)